MVGVTGFEPVTLRLSSACSNQLSYTPAYALRASARQARRLVGISEHCRTLPNAAPPDTARGRGLVELRRFELLTYSLQSYRSTN